jgi:uncharacterized membrane protein (UPF0127 family)
MADKWINFLLVVLLIVFACSKSPVIQTDIIKPESQVCSEETCFTVEIADSFTERQRGLMFRESLEDDRGMLFIFDEPGVHRFWMKNTLIPLDIIWIDENWTVIFVNPKTPPCTANPCPSYGPSERTMYVLEINSGLAEKSGISQGNELSIKSDG